MHRTLGAIAGFLYRRSHHIVVVTPAFKDHLIRYWKVPAEKISVVENGVETELFRPCPPTIVPGTEGRFVICYIGTMGLAHGLATLIAAAEHLQRVFPEAMFLLIGEGAEKDRIMQLADTSALRNIVFLGQQPRERIPGYIAGADVCLVMLRKTDLFKTVIPTKLLEYMACERPVIVAVDGQARQIVEEAGAGLFVEPEDADALAEAVRTLSADAEQRHRMGVSAREFIVSRFARERTARKYIDVLEALGIR
jgi:glycosyltransferase involved in cell wall biosynthesis